ncbi:prenyltransferase [Methylococcus sp. EFPC2]|uniref:prenyltransferase n=1 Tax=Methylococcus sp. EFPC2 TaxID=2812648 RepID=UPI0019681216|nr:prenyltransferase [Methylococcus sp. EFPC2]QSA98447.1 prenyltransferase [Methylococcus sp. EFPC2]
MNPAIYLVSILPGVGVNQLARPEGQALLTLLSATLAVVLLQHAINLWNDASDWRLGADVEKKDSWVRLYGGRTAPVVRQARVTFLLGSGVGLMLLIGMDRLWLLAYAAPLVGLGYLYNAGRRPLSYTCLGEWVTGLCYGGVFGGLWLLLRGEADRVALLGCLAFGCLASAVLLSHQPPQIETDRRAGKLSYAARKGMEATYRTARVLFLAFLIAWGFAVWSMSVGFVHVGLYLPAAAVAFAGACTRSPNPKYLLIAASLLFAVQELIYRLST